jgi:hypothetical protein
MSSDEQDEPPPQPPQIPTILPSKVETEPPVTSFYRNNVPQDDNSLTTLARAGRLSKLQPIFDIEV